MFVNPLREKESENNHDCHNHFHRCLLCGLNWDWNLQPQSCCKRRQFCSWRSKYWAVDFSFRIWYDLFLCRYFCRICRSVRMELRPFRHMDRHRQRNNRFTFTVDHTRTPHTHYDPAYRQPYNAGLFRHTL